MAANQEELLARGGHDRFRGHRSRSRQGFTLIELLTAIAIIVILMGMVLGAGVFAKQQATRARAKAELQELHNALQKYRIEKGEYPVEADFNEVRKNLPQALQSRFNRRNLNEFMDPWGREFVYKMDPANTEAYVLYSTGPKEEIAEDDIFSGK